jgi:hypothetical protein
MLLYAMLHLTGYDLSLDDLRQFRQLHSRTPGHPERGETPGVEPPPVRSARASATPSAWRWPSGSSPSGSTRRARPS